MREAYHDLRKLDSMPDWEWEELKDEELQDLVNLLTRCRNRTVVEQERRAGPPPEP